MTVREVPDMLLEMACQDYCGTAQPFAYYTRSVTSISEMGEVASALADMARRRGEGGGGAPFAPFSNMAGCACGLNDGCSALLTE